MSGVQHGNDNFLYGGDEVKKCSKMKLSRAFPEIMCEFRRRFLLGDQNCDFDVYVISRLILHRHDYMPGCVLVTGYDELDFPEFGVLKEMFSHDDIKYMVVENMEVQDYEEHMMSYVITGTNRCTIVPCSELQSYWPLSGYTWANKLCVINKYSHTTEFP